MSHKEPVIVSLVSLCFLAVVLVNLGYSDVPVTSFTSRKGDIFAVELGTASYVDSVLILVKNGESVISIRAETTSGQASAVSYALQGYYHWESIPIRGWVTRMVFVVESSEAELTEICLSGSSGEKLPISSIHGFSAALGGVERLTDEQGKVKLPITSESETYFDEVYFVRAAEDYLKGRTPYENTHPPLGKEIIALGIMFFGYSPFGWRIASAFFAALMIPLTYVLGRDVTRSRLFGLVASVLLSVDFLHFTYARIATVDTFVVFFILLSWVIFLKFHRQRDREGSPRYFELILWALSISLAVSTKWYALFALMGQMILLIVSRYSSLNKLRDLTGEQARPVLVQALLFVAVCVVVYLSTYLPQVVNGFTLWDFIVQQFQMLTYHTTLSALHSFSSPWFSWPVIYKPLWLYVSNLSPDVGSTIVAMGNPVVWWIGFTAIIGCAYRYCRKRHYSHLIVLVAFVSQWLPYSVLARPLFIYHYYMEVPILCLGIALLLQDYWKYRGSRYVTLAIILGAFYLFVVFYPVISGDPTSSQMISLLRWFNTWVF